MKHKFIKELTAMALSGCTDPRPTLWKRVPGIRKPSLRGISARHTSGALLFFFLCLSITANR